MGLCRRSIDRFNLNAERNCRASLKQEKPEFEVIKSLIERLDRLDRKVLPMKSMLRMVE
jgi:hypothetical protein